MIFKRDENAMMWEAFIKPYDNRLSDETTSDEYFHDPRGNVSPQMPPVNLDDEEEAETVVMELEPEGDLEIDGEDESGIDEVLLSDLKKLADYSQKLLDHCKGCEIDTWMVAKLIAWCNKEIGFAATFPAGCLAF